MIKVYGYSDDNVVIDRNGVCDEIGCFDKDVIIRFTDGAQIRIGYPKHPKLGVWWIELEKHGIAKYTLTSCTDEDAEVYSDVFETEADTVGYSIEDQSYAFGP